MSVYPFIEEDGSFTEAEVEERDDHHYYQRAKIESVPPSMTRIKMPSSTTVFKETFKKHEFAFKIDRGRIAIVDVFIHENFGEVRDKSGRRVVSNELLDKYIKENAPWVFSYARRIKVEKP